MVRTRQRQLPRVEGLAEIVVHPGLEAGDAVLRRAARGQHQDGHLVAVAAQGIRQAQPGFPRHHHVEDHQVEGHRAQRLPRRGGIGGGGDAEALLGEEALQQRAQPRIVIDQQQMRGLGRGGAHRPAGIGALQHVEGGVGLFAHQPAHHPAEAFHRDGPGLAIGAHDGFLLALEQPAFQGGTFPVRVSSRWRRSARPGVWVT